MKIAMSPQWTNYYLNFYTVQESFAFLGGFIVSVGFIIRLLYNFFTRDFLLHRLVAKLYTQKRPFNPFLDISKLRLISGDSRQLDLTEEQRRDQQAKRDQRRREIVLQQQKLSKIVPFFTSLARKRIT